MSRTRATMVTNVRAFINDSSTTSQTFSDATLTKWLNTGLYWMYESAEKRVKHISLVASWTAGLEIKEGDAATLYPEILEVAMIDASGYDLPLDELSWGELRYRQSTDPTTGTPTHYAKIKLGAAGVGASLQNKWKFALYPIPTNLQQLVGLVREYPTALSANADIVDLGQWECECIEVIAAVIAAGRMGRPELAQDLMGLLPKWIQDKLQTHAVHDETVA